MTNTRKPAIKHMTYEEARAETARLGSLTYDLHKQCWKLDEKAEYFDHIGMLWMRKVVKLFDAVRALEFDSNERKRQQAIYDACYQRYLSRLRQRNAIYNEKQGLYARMDTIRRRQNLVTKRGWETFGAKEPNRITVLWRTPRPVDLEMAS